MIPKNKPLRDQDSLNWVKTLDCVLTGCPSDDAHHQIGVGHGGMGTKASDLRTMPMTRGSHQEIHNNPQLWDMQAEYILRTIEEAFKQGVIVFDREALKRLGK